jgi:hypothetical protein
VLPQWFGAASPGHGRPDHGERNYGERSYQGREGYREEARNVTTIMDAMTQALREPGEG